MSHELRVLNGKEMTLGHKWEKMTMGHELMALNGKEMTVGLDEKNDFGLWMEKKWLWFIDEKNDSWSWA